MEYTENLCLYASKTIIRQTIKFMTLTLSEDYNTKEKENNLLFRKHKPPSSKFSGATCYFLVEIKEDFIRKRKKKRTKTIQK